MLLQVCSYGVFNTMNRCGETKEERKGEKGCLNCQPSLNITEITVK